MTHDCYKVYGMDTAPPNHPHLWDEGHSLVTYWLYYLLEFKYLENANAAGCGFSAPVGWDVWPYSWYNSGPKCGVSDAKKIRQTPPFVYRGPSSVDDARMDNYCCGQIAWSGASDARFAGRSGTWYPHLTSQGKPKPFFHCPVFATGPFDGRDNYLAPHAGQRSFRNRLTWPMSGGAGRDGHYLAETAGWSDGRAVAYEQPSPIGAWYLNYDGEVKASTASRF